MDGDDHHLSIWLCILSLELFLSCFFRRVAVAVGASGWGYRSIPSPADEEPRELVLLPWAGESPKIKYETLFFLLKTPPAASLTTTIPTWMIQAVFASAVFQFVCLFLGSIEERHAIYEEAWEKFPKGLVPRRLPLNFLTGMANHTSSF